MNTLGIIAEYNPFHNGHLYQINRAKELTGAKHIVAAMSGDFVQRGTPAWTDKYLRTQMALCCGIDMVFELPVTFSCSSAENFACAGVSLLTSLRFVDGICFGSECDDLPLLQEIAAFLAAPPDSFDETIRALTAEGLSYPVARQHALNRFWKNAVEKYPHLFSSPNNILTLEYLKAIQQLQSPLVPILIPRQGEHYHSKSLNGSLVSAAAIRKASINQAAENNSAPKEPPFPGGGHITGFLPQKQIFPNRGMAGFPPQKQIFLDTITQAVPQKVLTLLQTHHDRYPITEDNFSVLLYYRLSHLSEEDTAILDMAPGILHRIQKKLSDFQLYSDFTAKIKTKQYTYSRISRVLLHCLLDITAPPAFLCQSGNDLSKHYVQSQHTAMPTEFLFPCVPYTRLLGFCQKKSFLLRGSPGIPIITKPADGATKIRAFYHSLAENLPVVSAENIEEYICYACKLYEKDIFASNLYRQVQADVLGSSLPNEYCHKLVIT